MPRLKAADGCELYYEDEGSGDAVVLVHGAVSSARCFDSHIPALSAAGFRVIAPDLRGMGRSGRFTVIPPTAWRDDLLNVIDELGLERVHLCGTSLGARIALRLAIDFPDRVRSVVADSPVIADSPGGTAAITRLFGADLATDFAAQIEYWNGSDWRQVVGNFLMLRNSPGLQDHYDLSGEAERVRCPVLISRGDLDDQIHPLADSFSVHARVGSSRLWIAPDTGFSAMRFRADDFMRHYLSFLESLSTDTR
jgi:pimeloyl-ACP methyl ester carboxylesterase